ncbi:MAG: hypothetical protein R3A52_30705 [Polyangiales bacterium]
MRPSRASLALAALAWCGAAAGQARGPVALCGGVSATPTREGWSALGVTVPGDGEASVERVELGAVTIAVLHASSAEGAPAGVAVLRCPRGGAPTLAAHADARWRGEDVGDRARADVEVVRPARGAPVVLRGQRRESLSVCGLGSPLTEVAALDPSTGRWSPSSLDLAASLGAARPVVATVVRARPSVIAPTGARCARDAWSSPRRSASSRETSPCGRR